MAEAVIGPESTCTDCTYWVGVAGNSYADCRYLPPVPFVTIPSGSGGGGYQKSIWPKSPNNGWCACFKQRGGE